MNNYCEPQPVIADCLVQFVPAVPLYVVLWQGGVLDSGTQTSPAVVYFSLVALSLSTESSSALGHASQDIYMGHGGCEYCNRYDSNSWRTSKLLIPTLLQVKSLAALRVSSRHHCR